LTGEAGDFWVFGYGSLMWRPDFNHVEARTARAHGYHRALCIYSIRFRGSPGRPGLVFGLDRGGSCRGCAYRVATENVDEVIAYLDDREMLNKVYVPKYLKVRLDDGRRVSAYGFVARRDHRQYAGKLPVARAAELIRQGRGPHGSGLEYVANTVRHLDDIGIHDDFLHRVLAAARAGRG
jgi:cation transport protein ChaC